MELAFQLLLNGAVNGAHYALLGIGFGLIFATTGVVHFAYGPIYALAAYVAWWGSAVAGLPFLVAVVLAIAVASGSGLASYVWLYRPFLRQGSTPFIVLIVSLGLYVVIGNLIGVVFGTNAKTVSISYDFYFIGNAVLTGAQLWQVVALVGICLLLFVVLRRTRYGREIRAMQDNLEMARIIGINTERTSMVVFALGTAISTIPASLILIKEGALPHMGFLAVFYAFISVIVGGVGSLPGTVLGGILLGIIESLGVWQISSEWQSTIAFTLLFAVLLVRPTGLLRGH